MVAMLARRRGSRKQGQKWVGKDVEKISANPKSNIGKTRNILTPSEGEIFAAIKSLYDDELKPFGRILRKRIAERAVFDSDPSMERTHLDRDEQLPDVDIKHVQALCHNSNRLKVEPEEGGDWSVLVLDQAQSFIDIYNPCDHYSTWLWDSMSMYFQGSEGKDIILPGGRYSCAKALLARSVPFLSGYSLGKACHIVQLAMSEKKILGYANGSVVPYAKSQSKMKEDCAMSSQPCKKLNPQETLSSNGTNSVMPIASWETTRQYVQEILDSVPKPLEGNRTVPLSNVKRLFRSKYNTELSETMLGHSKLSELLQDAKLSDICTVVLGAQGYVVVEVSNACAQRGSDNTESNSVKCEQTVSTKSTDSDGCVYPDSLDLHIECGDDFAPLLGLSMAQSPDLFEQDEPQRPLQFCLNEPLKIEEFGLSSFGYSQDYACSGSMFSPLADFEDTCIGSIALSKVRNTFIHSPVAPPTPLRASASRRSRSLPKNVGSEISDNNAWEAKFQSLGCRGKKTGSSYFANERAIQPEFDMLNCTTPNVYDGHNALHGLAVTQVCNDILYVPPSPAFLATPTSFRTYSPYLRNAPYPPACAPMPFPCSFEYLQESYDPPSSPSCKIISLSSLLA